MLKGCYGKGFAGTFEGGICVAVKHVDKMETEGELNISTYSFLSFQHHPIVLR